MQRNRRVVACAFVLVYGALLAIGLFALLSANSPPPPVAAEEEFDLKAATWYVMKGRVRLISREGLVRIVEERVSDKGWYWVDYKKQDGQLTRWETSLE